MAGTATRYDSTKIRVGSVAQIWATVAIPGAGGRLTLATDGTPDATANPSAIHLGLTEKGSIIKIDQTVTDHFADEQPDPLAASFDQSGMSIEGSFLQIFDEEILKVITQNFGSYATAAGYKEFSVGRKPVTFTSIVLIWPETSDPTKFAVAQIYQALNTAGLQIGVDRKGMSSIPFMFKGYGIASRASTDTLGKYWWQI